MQKEPETRKITSYSFWSLFNLFDKCPFSFHLGAELGIRPKIERPKLNKAIIEGAVFHHVMENKTRQNKTWRDLIVLIEEAFKNIRARDDLQFSKQRETQVRKEMYRVFASTLRGDFREYLDCITLAEHTVRGIFKGVNLKGRIDALGIKDSRKFMADYKLNATASSGGSRQLAFYHLIEPVDEAFVYYPKMTLAKKVTLSPKRMDKLGEKVLELVDRIEKGDRSKKMGSCMFCNYKEVCVGKIRRPWDGRSNQKEEIVGSSLQALDGKAPSDGPEEFDLESLFGAL